MCIRTARFLSWFSDSSWVLADCETSSGRFFFHFVWNANQMWRVERLQKKESRDEAYVSTKYSDIEDLAAASKFLK